jgi:FtsX-like permease family
VASQIPCGQILAHGRASRKRRAPLSCGSARWGAPRETDAACRHCTRPGGRRLRGRPRFRRGAPITLTRVARLKELGIRAALGADRGDTIRLVIREGAGIAIAGSVAGFVLAFVGIRFASHEVFAFPPIDAATLVIVPVLLSAVVLLACYLLARRAARVDPMVVLRRL